MECKVIEYIKKIIIDTAIKAGIPEKHILEKTANSSILPKPALSIEIMEETITKSGYFLKRLVDKENKKFTTILSLYEAKLPIICNIYALSTDEVSKISDNFIKYLPRKCADKNNNIMKIMATTSTWEVVGGSSVGLSRIEPVINRERLIKIDVLYHITEETYKPLLEKLLINGQQINKEK